MERTVGFSKDWRHNFTNSNLHIWYQWKMERNECEILNGKITKQMSSNWSKCKLFLFWSEIAEKDLFYILCEMTNKIRINKKQTEAILHRVFSYKTNLNKCAYHIHQSTWKNWFSKYSFNIWIHMYTYNSWFLFFDLLLYIYLRDELSVWVCLLFLRKTSHVIWNCANSQ